VSFFDVSNREVIQKTGEWYRIDGLPRRSWTGPQLDDLAKRMTAALKRPGGTMALRPHQALALHDIGIYNGAICVMAVGTGKTLVTLMAYGMVEPEPLRVLLLTKAALIRKTQDDFADLNTHWLAPRGVNIASYESLGRESGAFFLEKECRPDFLILDECHMAKNKKAGVTKRLIRYMKDNPTTRVVDLSGTFFKASLRDAAHLITWALKNGAPVPFDANEVDKWSDAIDASSRVNPMSRHRPGALLEWATPEDWAVAEGDPLTAARRGFQRRMRETPGVIATGEEQVACSLNIIGHEFTPNAATEANFAHLRATWQTPDEWQLFQAMEVWACARQLSLGFHYVWDPRPPEEWQVRRKLWEQFVRDTLKKQKKVWMPVEGLSHKEALILDTPAQVARACRVGALTGDDGVCAAWDAIKPSFTPNSKAIWHDDTALNICTKWAKSHHGIIWTEHSFFARELSRRTGLDYYGRDGLTPDGRSLDPVAASVLAGTTKPHAIICSIKANATGRNLQGWNDNLITSIPTEASIWEQLLGRTHRSGQQADEVNVTTLFGCFEHIDGWNKAIELAQALQDTEGTSQKVLMATKVVPPVEFKPGPRWQKTIDERD
jgi:hypothetical protein